VTLRPLLCAVMKGPRGWFERAEGPTAPLKALGIGVPAEELVDVPIVAFLLEHPGAGLVLVDTGFHRSVAAGPKRERSRNLGAIGRILARTTSMRPEQAVAAQLRALGIEPADVGLVVMTHLHFDHASALSDFPGATVLLTRQEWQAALSRAPGMHGYVPAQLDPRLDYRTFEFAAAGQDADGAFAQSVDVFGDGSLTLAFTPGHTHGHLSLVVRLREREALLTGDAAYTMGTIREGARPWRSEDGRALERSIEQLAAWDRAHPEAVVIPGHDMEAWQRLEELYR
jgi:glyoxylase-like metal-dependent hydrolase (beta-lactamase superfamily II)